MLERGELRKLPDREGLMRIVEMDGVELNACGGTHVGSTGAIGGVMVRRLEKVKQGWRVEFCCGLRAVRAARRDYSLLTGVARTLSVGAGDVPDRVMRLLEERKAAAKELKAALKARSGNQSSTQSGDLPQAPHG
jgi:alanyl-tRNA synthetase